MSFQYSGNATPMGRHRRCSGNGDGSPLLFRVPQTGSLCELASKRPSLAEPDEGGLSDASTRASPRRPRGGPLSAEHGTPCKGRASYTDGSESRSCSPRKSPFGVLPDVPPRVEPVPMPKQLCRPPLLRARRAQALRQAAAVNPADLQEPTPVFRKSWCKDDFRVLRTVGTGFIGCVRVVKLRSSADRTPFALKIMRKREAIKLKQVEHVMSERQVLSTIKHPFIVELVTSFQDDACLFMLMEYVNGGELFTYLRRVRRLAVDAARFYTSEIVLALEYLHGLDVVYRDLKPENVLVDCKGHTKLTDFGFAKVVKQDTWTLCGTPEYLAPEIISTKGHGLAVDWWALGVLVFEMLVGTAPFTGSDTAEIYRRVVREEVRYPDHVGEDSVDLISRLMEKEKAKRLGNLAGGSDDVKSHVWFAAVDWDEMLQKRCAPPMMPAVRSPSDTCMFERYPTDDEGDNVPISEEEQELFKGFSTS